MCSFIRDKNELKIVDFSLIANHIKISFLDFLDWKIYYSHSYLNENY